LCQTPTSYDYTFFFPGSKTETRTLIWSRISFDTGNTQELLMALTPTMQLQKDITLFSNLMVQTWFQNIEFYMYWIQLKLTVATVKMAAFWQPNGCCKASFNCLRKMDGQINIYYKLTGFLFWCFLDIRWKNATQVSRE